MHISHLSMALQMVLEVGVKVYCYANILKVNFRKNQPDKEGPHKYRRSSWSKPFSAINRQRLTRVV